ncbi:MAG: alpha/beta fold hydrolase [Nitrospirae bacterium]|nr:alpha/beta fold hydrolase [Nitrospirota bacterium]
MHRRRHGRQRPLRGVVIGSPQAEFFELPDVGLSYRVLNPGATGLPLVMVMGWTGVKEDWESLSDALAADRPVLIFDNRGMGESSVPDGGYTMEMLAGDAMRLTEHVGWKRFHLLGISMGGMIAQTCALMNPDRIEKLVLACTHFGGRGVVQPLPEILAVFQAALGANSKVIDVRAYVKNLMPVNYTAAWVKANPSRVEELIERSLRYRRSRRGMMSQLSAVLGFDVSDRVSAISHETLVVHGTGDNLIPYENGVRLSKKIPRARLHSLPDAGHVFWDMDNGASALAIREFLGA